MSQPREKYEDNLQGVLREIVSAMSALNMEPTPLAQPLGRGTYLSQRDAGAAHCLEHLDAAVEILVEAHREREHDRDKLLRQAQTLAAATPAPEAETCNCGGKIDLLTCSNCRCY